MTRFKTKERDRRPPEVQMDIFRVFRAEDMRSEEIVEVLFNLLRQDRGTLPGGAPPPCLTTQQRANLLSVAARVRNGHDQKEVK